MKQFVLDSGSYSAPLVIRRSSLIRLDLNQSFDIAVAVTTHDTVVSYFLKQSSKALMICSTIDEQKTVSSHDSGPVYYLPSPHIY